jgi:hypothetical protein
VIALGILAIDPPSKIDEELLESAFEEKDIGSSGLGIDLIDAETGVSVDGRIDIMEVPFVGGDGATGVHKPLSEKEEELFFGKMGIDPCHGDHVKS